MEKAISNQEPDVVDRDFFQKLRRQLEHEISNYVYEIPEGTVGTPLSADQILSDLNSMRLCLVEPHWEEANIRDSGGGLQLDPGRKRMCVTMAEDEGYVLIYDPSTSNTIWHGAVKNMV